MYPPCVTEEMGGIEPPRDGLEAPRTTRSSPMPRQKKMPLIPLPTVRGIFSLSGVLWQPPSPGARPLRPREGTAHLDTQGGVMARVALAILVALLLLACTEVQPPAPDPRLDHVIERLDALDAKVDGLVQQLAADLPSPPTSVSVGRRALRECLLDRMFAPGVASAMPESFLEDDFDLDGVLDSMTGDGLGNLEALVLLGAIFGCWGD